MGTGADGLRSSPSGSTFQFFLTFVDFFSDLNSACCACNNGYLVCFRSL